MVTPTTVILLFTTTLLLLLAVLALHYREKRGATIFAVLQATSAVWAGLTVIGLNTSAGTLRVRIWGVTSGLSLVVVVLWVAFILSYTGRENWLSPRRLGVVSSPLVFVSGLYITNPSWPPLVEAVSQETIGAGTVVVAAIGPLGAIVGVYVYLVFLVGLALVVKTILEGPRLFVGQALAFLLGSLITIVSSLLVVLGIGVEGYPLTQVALGPQAIFWGYAVFGQKFLQIVPAVAEIGERSVFTDLNDGIVVVNNDGIIVRTNPQAEAYLDIDDYTGEPVTKMLDLIDIDSFEALPCRFQYSRQTFRADVSEIRDWQDESIGYSIVIRDINQLVTREQRLAVLNRILRHNVRNDMNIVLGIGEELQSKPDTELSAYGDSLGRTARNLERMSEKALEINRMYERSITTEQVDLRRLIDEITSQMRAEYPDATIETSLLVESIRTDASILRQVVDEVIANALEHGSQHTTVQITARVTDNDIELVITDDGPGIPESEVEALLSGKESQLEHTSSFGLWFIKWGTEKIGGGVDMASNENGTTVTLILPDNPATADQTEVTDIRSDLISP